MFLLRVMTVLALGVLLSSCLLTLITFIPAQADPMHWYLWIVTQFRFQYCFVQLLGLLCFVGIYRKFKLISLIVAVCFVLNAAIILPYYRIFNPNPHKVTEKGIFQVLLSNVGFISDYRLLMNYIKAKKPDIVCIVELEPKLQHLLSSELWKKEYPFQKADNGSQIGLYSKFPLVSAELEPADNLVGPSLDAVVQVRNTQFNLVLSHPVVPYSPAALRKQERHFQKWGTTWSEKMTQPLLIVGDMNSVPWVPAFGSMLRQTRLRDSETGFGIQPSWPANDPMMAIPIDHVLVSRHFEVLDRLIGPDVGSDHRPVLVKLVLSP